MLGNFFKQGRSILIYVVLPLLLIIVVFLVINKNEVKVTSKGQRTTVMKKTDANRFQSLSRGVHVTGKPDSSDFSWGNKISIKDIKTKFNFDVKLPSEKVKNLTGNIKTVFAREVPKNEKSDGIVMYFDKGKIEIWEESSGGFLTAEEEMESWKNNDDYEQNWKNQYRLVDINGIKGIGREPGVGETDNGAPAPGVVWWWAKNKKVEYSVYGNGVSVKGLLKIARSLE